MSFRLRNSIKRALLLAAAGTFVAATSAHAQSNGTNPLIEEIEVVVITGSYIAGTVQDAALPVQVISTDDLEKQGSPNMTDLVKSIPQVQSIIGESNQFGAAQNTGVSNINLRGLGGVRTLVLMNGRRLPISASTSVTATGGIGVDTNLIPTAAIGRIEVLRDGAAATYGSDAVGGVVNFITRKGVDGLSVDGSYTYIEGSDGDYSTNLIWGNTGETYDFLVTAGYRHRSELQVLDRRDFALRSFTENPQGGFSSFSNPGVFQLLNASRTAPIGTFRDPGCGILGGVETGTTASPGCQFQFTQFDNLVEREEHYNLYSEFNRQLTSATNLHFEAFYAAHDVPEENSSPSYAPTQGPGATVANPSNAPNYFIPLTNPGLAALLPSLTTAQQAAITAAGGVRASGLQFRPFGLGGNPLTGEGKKDSRFFDSFRVSTGLDGELKGVNWNVALTYSEGTRDADTPDILVGQLDRALRGFGGSNCTGTVAGDASAGCYYFNPFSTGIAMNPALGLVNPAQGSGGTFVANTVNNPDVVRALFGSYSFNDKTSLAVLDAVFNGETGLSLPGGKVAWALGLQYREDGLERDFNDDTNVDVNPCADTPITGNTTCTTMAGPLSFLGTLREVDLSGDVYGVFTELSLPVTESIQAQLAYRYEDYGGKTGSTSNPKLSVRWQATDWLGLRASVGSTFRGPLLAQLLADSQSTLLFTSLARVVPPTTPGGASTIQNLSGFRPYDNFGDPNLKPEDADTLNAGVFFSVGAFTASFDYFSIHLKDPITAENGTDIVREFFGTATALENHCGEAAFAGLQTRFTFAGGVCAPQNILRTRANVINGPDEKTSGIDASMQYKFQNVFAGELALGLDASYLLEYERDRFFVEGIEIEGAGGMDFAGTRSTFTALPELRGSVYLDWSTQSQSLRLTSRYIDGVTDIRTTVADPVTGKLFEVGSFLTHDLVYRVSLPLQTTLTAAVFNFTDRDPPFARQEYSYDPFIANPIGRSFKLSLNKRF